jgi:predicted DNA-binding protein YlxM (UPF0122 family)
MLKITLETLNKKEFKRLYPHKTTAELAEKYGVPRGTITTWAKRLKMSKDKIKTRGLIWSRNDENYILKHYGKDHTIEEIAETLKRSKWSVINKYRELTHKRTPRE